MAELYRTCPWLSRWNSCLKLRPRCGEPERAPVGFHSQGFVLFAPAQYPSVGFETRTRLLFMDPWVDSGAWGLGPGAGRAVVIPISVCGTGIEQRAASHQ